MRLNSRFEFSCAISTDDPQLGGYSDVTFDLKCQSDSIRMTRHCRVSGTMYCPVNETKVAIILSDSRLLFWDLQIVDYQVKWLEISVILRFCVIWNYVSWIILAISAFGIISNQLKRFYNQTVEKLQLCYLHDVHVK